MTTPHFRILMVSNNKPIRRAMYFYLATQMLSVVWAKVRIGKNIIVEHHNEVEPSMIIIIDLTKASFNILSFEF